MHTGPEPLWAIRLLFITEQSLTVSYKGELLLSERTVIPAYCVKIISPKRCVVEKIHRSEPVKQFVSCVEGNHCREFLDNHNVIMHQRTLKCLASNFRAARLR